MLKSMFAAAISICALSGSALAESRGVEGQGPRPQARAFPDLTGIYAASGARDNGGASSVGTATSVLCTNWTTVDQTLRVVLRDDSGTIVGDETALIVPRRTLTFSSHFTAAFFDDFVLAPGSLVDQGAVQVFSTASQVTCTVMIVDAASAEPSGIGLHLVRFNAWAGTQE